jgi:hypothetical protein
MDVWRYGSTHSECSALPSEEAPPMRVGQGAGWAPKQVWTLWKKKKKRNFLFLSGIEPVLLGRPVCDVVNCSKLSRLLRGFFSVLMCIVYEKAREEQGIGHNRRFCESVRKSHASKWLMVTGIYIYIYISFRHRAISR